MLPVSACCIDSGYESQAVYDFCRTRYHRRVFAVKGQGGPHPVWPKKPTAKNIRGERPWMVGTRFRTRYCYRSALLRLCIRFYARLKATNQ
jgi:phage terminase large subunit GpA-like protein